jgi:hypothetical protein
LPALTKRNTAGWHRRTAVTAFLAEVGLVTTEIDGGATRLRWDRTGEVEGPDFMTDAGLTEYLLGSQWGLRRMSKELSGEWISGMLGDTPDRHVSAHVGDRVHKNLPRIGASGEFTPYSGGFSLFEPGATGRYSITGRWLARAWGRRSYEHTYQVEVCLGGLIYHGRGRGPNEHVEARVCARQRGAVGRMVKKKLLAA